MNCVCVWACVHVCVCVSLSQITQEEEEEEGEDSDMVDLSLLTDDQLKCKLLQYGVKAGPIVGQYFLKV